ncbi:MAG: tetratricopeptide repeat protein [Acidobacteriaceae bacterium]|nr:tetratricopeptide repeat protein [Acidobacteriaceae bacterium]
MKHVFALASLCALLFSGACTQNPEKLLATANKYHQKKQYKEASILYQKVIAKDKTNAEAYYREGLNLIDDHQPIQAMGYLRRAVDLKPNNTDAEVKLAEIYLAIYASDTRKYRSMLEDVRDLSAKISAHSPNSYDSLRIQGLLDLADQNTDKALDAFRKANQLKPYSADLVGWYAQTLIAAQHRDEAITLVQNMLTHDKTWGPGYDFLFMQYSRANDPAKAEATLRDRVQNDPSNASGYINLANFLLATNRYSEAEPVIRKLLNDKKAFPNAHQLVGDFYVRAKKYDDALTQYKEGLKDNPKQAVGYQERIVAVNQLAGRTAEALQLAKEVASKNPKDTTANEVYASLLLQRGTKADLTNSATELKNLVQRNPSNAVLHLDLAKAYYGLGNVDGALNETQEALRQNSKLIQARLLAARIYNDRGDSGKAIEESETVLSAEPGNPEARFIHARALLASGQMAKGQSELEGLVSQFPNLNEARVQLASLYLQEKSMDKAKEQYEKVWNSNPPDYRGFVGLQTIKMAQGQVDQAIQAMQDIVQKNPKNDGLRSQLANFEALAASLEAKSNPERAKQLAEAAVADLQQVVKTSPQFEDAWIRLGVLQRSEKQDGAALASFERAEAINPRSAAAFLNQAVLLESMGKKKEAAATYNKVLGIDPQNTLALNNLAFLNAEQGTNLDQAMTWATKAQRQVPDSPDVSDTLGYVYYQKNLNAEALQIFRKVVQDYPQNPTFHFHLAMALLKQGDKQGARNEAEKAMKNAPPQQQSQIRTFVGQIG